MERKGVTIDIRIPLNPKGGNSINMAQEIAKKYGWDAINPRAAEHRERIRQMHHLASKHDSGTGDDMSVDLTSEMGDESNAEMGGMDDDRSNTEGQAKPRQRRKRVEEYDKEDDFIDDTELFWEQQAATTKDGFFVYSGPLIKAGEPAQIESATAAGKGGRGRGRGRGARSGAAGGTHASLADKARDTVSAPARTRGRGRAAGAPRKPRMTKADRERLEAEKQDRERAAQHYGGPTGAPVKLAPIPQQQYAHSQPMTAAATTTTTTRRRPPWRPQWSSSSLRRR